MNEDTLYSVNGARMFLGGVSLWAIHAWIKQGRLVRTKVGSRTMIRESDLNAFLAACNTEKKPTVKQ